MLQRNPNISVFFGQADALALGAAQAVKVANLGHKVWVVGFDGDVAGLKAVQDGVLDATMTQQTQQMGRHGAVDRRSSWSDGEKVRPSSCRSDADHKDNVERSSTNHP